MPSDSRETKDVPIPNVRYILLADDTLSKVMDYKQYGRKPTLPFSQ